MKHETKQKLSNEEFGMPIPRVRRLLTNIVSSFYSVRTHTGSELHLFYLRLSKSFKTLFKTPVLHSQSRRFPLVRNMFYLGQTNSHRCF